MRRAYSLTRGLTTLAGVVGAAALIWAASRFFEDGLVSIGEYWGIMGLLAAAGLVMALSQLLGGWTKAGSPVFSLAVFLLAFVPALVVGGFMVWFSQQPPEDGWLVDDVQAFADDIGIDGLVLDLQTFLVLFPFLIGLLFGFCFDTVPREPRVVERRARDLEDEQPTEVVERRPVVQDEQPTEVVERRPDLDEAPTHPLTPPRGDER